MSQSSDVLHIESATSNGRRAAMAEHVSVLTDIYQEDVNIAVWHNKLADDVLSSITKVMAENSHLNVKISTTPESVAEELLANVPQLGNQKALCKYIELLVEMFCTLFELKSVGLRLAKLDKAMCPKFHVDHIPCRLVTTFCGVATQWLPDDCIDRSKLGAGSQNQPDDVSGVMLHSSNIQHLTAGDVALLKGEGWYNNENGGLIHRSPAVAGNEQRLLLTLDFID